MKHKLAVFILSAFCVLSTFACSGPNTAPLTLQPGVPQTVYWDFTDCTFGITYFTIYVTQPLDSQGNTKPLPSNTPLVVDAVNLTTSEVAIRENPFIVSFFSSNESGGLIQLTLTLSPKAKKSLSVQVSTSGNYGGVP